MKKLIISKDHSGFRLDKSLCQIFDISFALSQKLLRQKKIKVNSKTHPASYRLQENDNLEIISDINLRTISVKKTFLNQSQLKKFQSWIVYEDKDFVAINKPSGLATQGGSGIKISVDDFAKHHSYQLVHRLDKDTSGILLMAKSKSAAEFLIDSFKNKNIKKTYIALVNGIPTKNHGKINIPLRKKIQGKNEKVLPDFEEGKEAITDFKILRKFTDYCLIELRPITGRTHQLRVHMKELGHPIINDVKYGGKSVLKKDISDRLCLHAHKIVIDQYLTKDKIEIIASEPSPNSLNKF